MERVERPVETGVLIDFIDIITAYVLMYEGWGK